MRGLEVHALHPPDNLENLVSIEIGHRQSFWAG
jgi:hypothetical protein